MGYRMGYGNVGWDGMGWEEEQGSPLEQGVGHGTASARQERRGADPPKFMTQFVDITAVY